LWPQSNDPSRIRRSRDVSAYLGLVPRRYQSGEVDYVGSISKCGDMEALLPKLKGRRVALDDRALVSRCI
jgi:transposase